MWGVWPWMLESSSGVCVITDLLCLLLATLFKPSPSKLPPGPFPLPLVGHLHLFTGAAHPARSLAQMSHHFGPLISLKLGSIPFIVASTPEAARQILQTHDQTFAFRDCLASVNAIYGACPGITFSDPTSPYWRFLRQLCATDLFSFCRLQQFKPIRDEEVRALLQSVYADDTINNKTISDDQDAEYMSPVAATRLVHLRPKLQKATNNIISRMAIGVTSLAVLRPVLEANEALCAVNLGDFLPWMQWADLRGCVKQSKKAGLRMHAAIQGLIDQRRKQRAGVYEPPADVLDILLSACGIVLVRV